MNSTQNFNNKNDATADILNNEELKDFLRRNSNKAKSSKIAAIIGGVVGALSLVIFYFGNVMPLFYVGIIALAVMFISISINVSATKAIKARLAATLLPATLNEIFDDVYYDMNAHVSEETVRYYDMGFPHFDKMEGSDYVSAKYKGLDIEMSDINLIEITETRDKDGHVQRTETSVFKGMWLTCDFAKELTADLVLRERSLLGKKTQMGGVKTESEDFNSNFYIESQNELEVFYILTPHMMEYILEMDRKGNGKTFMRFCRDGKVHIAIDSGRDSFEINGNLTDIPRFHEQFTNEIRYVTDLIDELRLVDTMYKYH